MDILAVRRRIDALHSDLRNEGRNPLEAVALLAAAIQPKEAPSEEFGELSEGTRRQFAALFSHVPADGELLSVAFQEFLTSEARNGLGQYLTPLPVANLVASVAAKYQPASALDPFAGSGLLLEKLGERLPEVRLLGIEINKSAASVARAVGRLASRTEVIREGDAFALWIAGEIPQVDAVVTNPPFGAVATTVTPMDLWSVHAPEALLRLGSLPAELLGLDLSVSVLRDGGFLGIVLPQSVLTNSRWGEYRAQLFRRVQPIAVVSLPEETFAPFKGVAKACILFGQKGAGALPVTFPYLRSQAVGYDETGRLTGYSDLTTVLDAVLGGDTGNSATIDASGALSVCASWQGTTGTPETHLLGEIATVFTGRTFARDAYATQGPRLLKVGDLSGSFISWRERPRGHVPRAVFDKHRRCHLRIGDICLTAAAHKPRYIGLKVDLVDKLPAEGAMASAEVLVIRLNSDAPICPEELLFYFRSRQGYSQLQDLVRGSTAHLYPSDVERLAIPAIGQGARADAAAKRLWEAAAAFRKYLELEAEALELAVPGGPPPPEGDDEES